MIAASRRWPADPWVAGSALHSEMHPRKAAAHSDEKNQYGWVSKLLDNKHKRAFEGAVAATRGKSGPIGSESLLTARKEEERRRRCSTSTLFRPNKQTSNRKSGWFGITSKIISLTKISIPLLCFRSSMTAPSHPFCIGTLSKLCIRRMLKQH